MRKLAILAAFAVAVSTVGANAADVKFTIRQVGDAGCLDANCTNTSGPAVNFEIVAHVIGIADNNGLALWGADLQFTGGSIANLTNGKLDDPSGVMQDHFDYPNGVTNPAHVLNDSGYRGTVSGANLLQGGGGQNTIGNPPTGGAPFPIGAVLPDVANGASGQVVATGTYTHPGTGGAHVLQLANCFANTIDEGETGPTVYDVSAANVTFCGSLTVSGVGGTVSTAVSDGTSCDIQFFPAVPGPRETDSRQQGADTVLVFNYTGGAPANNVVTIVEDLTCPGPAYGLYTGPVPVCVAGANLTCTFTPGLPKGAYRLTVPNGGATLDIELRMLVGDANRDGFVNSTDRSVVVGQWTSAGYSCPTDQFTDVNDNGATDSTDRSLVVGAWTGGAATNCAP